MSLHHILVRDFSSEQKKRVEEAADSVGKSTSRFCRDSAVEAAGGKIEKEKESKKPAAKKAVKAKPTPKKRRR